MSEKPELEDLEETEVKTSKEHQIILIYFQIQNYDSFNFIHNSNY